MATQAAIIAETVASMKRVIHGRHPLSDSDDSLPRPTNRGYKLKRKAQFAHEGHLSGQRVYKRKIVHAGYERFILSRNPKRYDIYNDELEDDEADEQADMDALERNPYGEVKLEELLRPLTSAARLPDHPSLSIPYTSPILPDMVQQACEMVHKEKKTLWEIKKLLIKFRGDESWIPCENLQLANDAALFGSELIEEENQVIPGHHQLNIKPDNRFEMRFQRLPNVPNNQSDGSKALRSLQSLQSLAPEPMTQSLVVDSDTTMTGINLRSGTQSQEGPDIYDPDLGDISTAANNQSGQAISRCPLPEATIVPGELNGEWQQVPYAEVMPASADSQPAKDIDQPMEDAAMVEIVEDRGAAENSRTLESGSLANDGDQAVDSLISAHRMTTRAQAQAVSDRTASSHTRSASPDASAPPDVHPLYLVPSTALSDRDFGLPPAEAEDTRRILMMWIQKQEEVCRGAVRLYEGLLKADRMRSTVLAWCKAEGHCREMSDGEDWYDKEHWGLDEDLRKGQYEEDDETANQGKKTRGRRVAQ